MNMLPSAIALRLSALPVGGHIADSFESATILFADIVGFTAMTEMLPPLIVVEYLNRIFSAFDEIAEELCVEKIKTIGDAYMAVAGIPEKTENNAEEMLRFAIRMLSALDKFNSEAVARGEPQFGLRVGINSGTVVAGVIGSRKFLFDIWGSAANLASRMESTGVDRRIQLTDKVFQLTKHVTDFRFTLRGLVHCKGIGNVLTYYVEAACLPTIITTDELGDVV
jgi:adenylate cyclase